LKILDIRLQISDWKERTRKYEIKKNNFPQTSKVLSIIKSTNFRFRIGKKEASGKVENAIPDAVKIGELGKRRSLVSGLWLQIKRMNRGKELRLKHLRVGMTK
jgi:hypothetical protein